MTGVKESTLFSTWTVPLGRQNLGVDRRNLQIGAGQWVPDVYQACGQTLKPTTRDTGILTTLIMVTVVCVAQGWPTTTSGRPSCPPGSPWP